VSAAAGAADPLPFAFGPAAAGGFGLDLVGGAGSLTAAGEEGAGIGSEGAGSGTSEGDGAASATSVSAEVGSGRSGGGVASGAVAAAGRLAGSGEDGRLEDGLWPASAACLSRSERDGMRRVGGEWASTDGRGVREMVGRRRRDAASAPREGSGVGLSQMLEYIFLSESVFIQA
jgi:hypothetical protein